MPRTFVLSMYTISKASYTFKRILSKGSEYFFRDRRAEGKSILSSGSSCRIRTTVTIIKPAFSKKIGGYYRGRLHRTPPSHDTAFPSVVTSFYFNRAKFSIQYNLQFSLLNIFLLRFGIVWCVARYCLFYKGDII